MMAGILCYAKHSLRSQSVGTQNTRCASASCAWRILVGFRTSHKKVWLLRKAPASGLVIGHLRDMQETRVDAYVWRRELSIGRFKQALT